MPSWIYHCAGIACIGAAIADVLLTVRVARYGNSLLSEQIFAGTWRVFRLISRSLLRVWCQRLLIFAGPLGLAAAV